MSNSAFVRRMSSEVLRATLKNVLERTVFVRSAGVNCKRGTASWAKTSRFFRSLASHRAESALIPEYSEDPLEDLHEQRSVFFVFSGLGSQQNQLPRELFLMEPFGESLIQSRRTLKNLGLNMDEILRPNNDTIYTCIRSALMSLAVLQMAMYDTLKELLPTEPKGFIGHSAGEALCGYADGSLSSEQVLLLNEARAQAMVKTKGNLSGGMASVGVSWHEIHQLCPPGIYPACNNSRNSVIVAGPRSSIRTFTKQLQDQGIFAREVDACDFAPHSPYIEEAAQLLGEYARPIIPVEILRSPKWICTSAPEQHWDSEVVQWVSSKYFVNNMRNHVYFYEALDHVPRGALIIEISPKPIFGGILKESICDSLYFAPISRGDGTINSAMLSKDNFNRLLY